MKNAIVIIFLCIASAVHAQPVITYADQSMHPGDYHKTVFTAYKAPGEGGAGQVWDFSGQKILNDHHAEILPAGETPFSEEFPQANMAIKEHGNYFFFDVQPASSSYHGYVKNNRLVIRYDKGAEKMRYPFHYEDSYTGDFTAKTPVSTIYGNYRIESDGYGTLKLPGGIVLQNVLRVKSTEDFVEEACNSVHAHTEKVSWYHPAYRYPVYVMFYRKEEYLNKEKPKIYRYGILSEAVQKRRKAAGMDKQEPRHSYKVLPNPFVEEVRIQYELRAKAAVQIEVFNMQGRRVTMLQDKDQPKGSYTIRFIPERYTIKPGNYLVKIMLGKQVNLEKLVYLSD